MAKGRGGVLAVGGVLLRLWGVLSERSCMLAPVPLVLPL